MVPRVGHMHLRPWGYFKPASTNRRSLSVTSSTVSMKSETLLHMAIKFLTTLSKIACEIDSTAN